MPSTNEINAKNLVKKADGFMKPSMLRWKPDFNQAAEMYESAARTYRASNAYEDASNAEEKCADANIHVGNYWHAGKALERATEMVVKSANTSGEEVLALAERASEAYIQANRSQVAAESMSRAAKLLEEKDPATAVALLNLCVEMLGDDGKDVYATEHHRRICGLLLQMERYQDAATACLKFAQSCSVAGQTHSLAKAYLCAVVAMLYEGDGEGAQSTFSDVHEVPGFENSDERQTAYNLLEAYRSANTENIKRAVADSQCVRFLDVAFARLAAKLPNPKHELANLAVKMGVALDGEDTDDDNLT
jgi:tetratricopeptide (TPR) repeat protein